jgi:hypothetical protein
MILQLSLEMDEQHETEKRRVGTAWSDRNAFKWPRPLGPWDKHHLDGVCDNHRQECTKPIRQVPSEAFQVLPFF